MSDGAEGTSGRTEDPAVEVGLVATPPPPAAHKLGPDQVEQYVRASITRDRTPGNLLVVVHPFRRYKVPRPLLRRLERAGFSVTVVETQADRIASVEGIRDALRELSAHDEPLDVLVITGDGSLDHHVLVAAWWAFFPELVAYREGAIDCGAVTREDLGTLPREYVRAFCRPMPECSTLDATPETLVEIWLLRARLERALRKGRPVSSILRRARRDVDDLVLRVTVLATLLPDKVVLRAHGFDLSALAEASREVTYRGLYPFIRSIAVYPAGTAADNAVFAGVPGWAYAQAARLLTGLSWLEGLREWAEDRVSEAFLRFYLSESVVVPARFSVVGFDGDWQLLSSHAAGGPAAGHFFTADLVSKTKGMSGYLARIPAVLFHEGLLGSTVVRVRATFAGGSTKSFVEARLAEGLYTNRTFIAGVGSVPSTDPTSFAGQSSLLLVPPLWARGPGGEFRVNLRGALALAEAITKGILARNMHVLGLRVGKLAGGGKLSFLLPEHQLAIQEGERIDIRYLTRERQARAVPVQVSGDPFQAWRMHIHAAWGPLPLLARSSSLLLASTRRSLSNVRTLQSYKLQGTYVGGLYTFRHTTGEPWTPEFSERTGLVRPPLHLRRNLTRAQAKLLRAWKELGTGEFVDTTESGLSLGRRGRYAHNSDQTAHLVVVRERAGILLVRQIRAWPETGDLYETRTWYQRFGATWIIHQTQTRVWREGEAPRILQEDHYFRDAEAFQQEAPSFFPFASRWPEARRLLTREDSEPGEDL